ncbi:MAG: cobalamin biosynthesis protein CobD [Actinobacteria bacterium]|jgi:adenosylcobinamide-phosphate synthase|nr:MAG: cobalamin biosynthesis protein CobD [Actinomycetota bacterium]
MLTAGALKIASAYGLDHLLGDPEGYPHPVRLMGKAIDLLEEGMAPEKRGSEAALRAGYVLAGVLAGGAWLSARLLLLLPGKPLIEILLLYTCIARKDLEKSALRVAEDLETGDMAAARRNVVALVGRDPGGLDEAGMCRAVVESVAENFTDGVLAPLLWAAAAGVPAAMAFKAISTLDSMVGHRDARYLNLGRCSARLDDMAVFTAARVSIPLTALAALLCGYDARSSVRAGLRDRRKHASPNSAHAEAAFAGALGLRLGGTDLYAGKRRELPELGMGTRMAEPAHIRKAVRLLNAASLLGLVLSMTASGRRER